MTPEAFRKLALELPQAVEGQHMGHADFRVGGKIFATLGYPSLEFATVLITREEQLRLLREAPAVFVPVKGGWGLKGSTHVRLAAADRARVKRALQLAWKRKAPMGREASGAVRSARRRTGQARSSRR